MLRGGSRILLRVGGTQVEEGTAQCAKHTQRSAKHELLGSGGMPPPGKFEKLGIQPCILDQILL